MNREIDDVIPAYGRATDCMIQREAQVQDRPAGGVDFRRRKKHGLNRQQGPDGGVAGDCRDVVEQERHAQAVRECDQHCEHEKSTQSGRSESTVRI